MPCLHTARYWMCKPEMLLPILAEHDVPLAGRKIWLCECGIDGCGNAVGYGVGGYRAHDLVTREGVGAPSKHVLWLVPSCKFIEGGKVPIFGLEPGETVEQMLAWYAEQKEEGVRLQGQWWSYILDGVGFRPTVEAALRELAS